MTELERRALLGDQQAQEECTEKGIVLPCPFCGKNAGLIADNGIRVMCLDCGAMTPSYVDKITNFVPDRCAAKIVVRKWNTRPAPLVGRCSECGHSTVDLDYGKTWCNLTLGCREVKPDGFCNEFKPKEDKEK